MCSIRAIRQLVLQSESTINFTELISISSSSLLLSIFNLLFILGGLVRIFVYGEPSICKVSAWAQYWTHRRQADREVGRGDGAEGGRHLVQAALCLGRPPPNTTLDSLASLLWQMILLLLDTFNLPTLLRRVMKAEKRLVIIFHILILFLLQNILSCCDRLTFSEFHIQPTYSCYMPNSEHSS